jgi:hypothetical protein
MTDEERTRRLLDALMPVPAAPADLAQRVFQARDGAPIRRARRWPWVVAATAMAAAMVILLVRRHDTPGASALALHRQTVDVGGRAIAVIEPRGEISWRKQGGEMRVEQRRGDVFYRVDHGGAFVVAAPAGEVTVTGTCFRVALQGKSVEAAYVQVLEGSVEIRNSAGKEALIAGEWGRLVAGRAPERMTRSAYLPVALDAPFTRPHETTAQAQVATVAGVIEPPKKIFLPTSEQRIELARTCRFRWGFPRHLNRAEVGAPPKSPPMTADELAAVVRVLEDHRAEYFEQLRGIYTEITGEHADPTVAAMALHHEIDDKGSRPEGKTARQRILQEWAGDVEPPPAGAAQSPMERFWRLQATAMDETLRRLTPVLGAERARAVMEASGDMLVTGTEDGCPSGK